MSFLIYEVVGLYLVRFREGVLPNTSRCKLQLRNPDILAKLRAELDASIPFDVLIPSLSQVRLPYLNMLLKGTLRYSSTGFGTFRTCPVDTEISGVVLPANTTLALWNPAGKIITIQETTRILTRFLR